MKKSLLLIGLAMLLTGCFSIMRIPFEQYSEHHKNPETGEWVKTNVVVGTCPNFPMCKYPTLHLRWHLLAFTWEEAPDGYEWQHFTGPISAIVSCIGLPGDFLIDTCYLYHDWDAYKTASCPICNRRSNWDTVTPAERLRRIKAEQRKQREQK